FYRCGDNLNLLSSTPTVAHPDRHEFPRFPLFEDWDLSTLNGFDTGLGLVNQPQASATAFAVRTTVGNEDVLHLTPAPDDCGLRIVQTPMRFPFSSYQINVVEASSAKYVAWRQLKEVAQGPFLPADGELPYATLHRRAYLLRSRMNYPLKWS